MKFSDGFWLNQRGFNVNYAVMAYEITTTPNSITVLQPLRRFITEL